MSHDFPEPDPTLVTTVNEHHSKNLRSPKLPQLSCFVKIITSIDLHIHENVYTTLKF